MKNKHAFYKARDIDYTLIGDNWPEKLTVSQISKLYCPNNETEKRVLFKFLEDSIKSGSLGFDDVSACYSWSYGVLSDMVGGTNYREMTLSHEPVSGWPEFLKGLKPGDVKDFSRHLCECEAKCTLEQIFDNGLPKKWTVKGVHSDGLKIEFICRGLPLISAKGYKDFFDDNGVVIPDKSYLNNWIDKLESKKAEQETTTKLEPKQAEAEHNTDPESDKFSSQKPERAHTKWFRETWKIEDKPRADVFFRRLKKHKGKEKSPILDWYEIGPEGAGVKIRTATGKELTISKKRITNMVSVFFGLGKTLSSEK